MSDLKRSPLDELHREAGGLMVSFAGWEMPVRYASTLEEHKAVRTEVGQFDISHMGQLFVEGKLAEEWLNSLLTNDVSSLKDGQGHYTFLLNEKGGVIDDLILYRIQENSYFMVVNAACLAKDLAWFQEHALDGVSLLDRSESLAGIAVQGPKAVDVFSRVFGGRTLPSYNGIDVLTMDGQSIWVCRTGYTGEDGFGFFCSAASAERWWEDFAESGAKPCGFGARDSLRLEKGFPLNGADLNPARTPLEAGLEIFVKLEKGDFIGSDILREQRQNPPPERLVAILCDDKGAAPRPGDEVLDESGETLGTLTSGMLSPCLALGIGLAYLPSEAVKIGTQVFIKVQGNKMPAKIVKKPFVA